MGWPRPGNPALMLSLDDARWGELTQAYGPARDVARLLAHLDVVDDDERRELWVGLWATLCGRDGVYTASYAAVPHLVAFAARQPAHERARALHLVAAIEAARVAEEAPPMPGDVVPGYRAAIAAVPGLVCGAAGEAWDADTAQILCGVLAVAKGHPGFGSAALRLEGVTVCPGCGARHPTAGWNGAHEG